MSLSSQIWNREPRKKKRHKIVTPATFKLVANLLASVPKIRMKVKREFS